VSARWPARHRRTHTGTEVLLYCNWLMPSCCNWLRAVSEMMPPTWKTKDAIKHCLVKAIVHVRGWR
jgi:hypothetical protein